MIPKKVWNVLSKETRRQVSWQRQTERSWDRIVCGHDGRRGCFYHVCVAEAYRKHGIGKTMAVAAMRALKAEKINKVCLIAFKDNEIGNCFWKSVGWTFREDLNYYDFTLNEENITNFNK